MEGSLGMKHFSAFLQQPPVRCCSSRCAPARQTVHPPRYPPPRRKAFPLKARRKVFPPLKAHRVRVHRRFRFCPRTRRISSRMLCLNFSPQTNRSFTARPIICIIILMYPVDLLLIRSMKTLPLLSEIPDGATIKIPGLPIIPPFAQHWIACLRQTLPTVLLTNIKTISRAMTACFISALATGAAIFSTKAANFH